MLSLSDGMFSGVRENSLTLMIRKEVVILDDDTLVTSVFSGRTRWWTVLLICFEEDLIHVSALQKTKTISCCDFPKNYTMIHIIILLLHIFRIFKSIKPTSPGK